MKEHKRERQREREIDSYRSMRTMVHPHWTPLRLHGPISLQLQCLWICCLRILDLFLCSYMISFFHHLGPRSAVSEARSSLQNLSKYTLSLTPSPRYFINESVTESVTQGIGIGLFIVIIMFCKAFTFLLVYYL